jgi:hypothetical protein
MDLLAVGLKLPVIGNIIRLQYQRNTKHPVTFLGIDFPNPIGLAAGFDKDARWLHLLKNLGFGFVEVGTVTPLPQEGNPKPRLFRLKKDLALINRMGFNNQGIDAMVERLKNRPDGLIVGGNIGKNKATPNEKAIDDYRICGEREQSQYSGLARIAGKGIFVNPVQGIAYAEKPVCNAKAHFTKNRSGFNTGSPARNCQYGKRMPN